MGFTNDLFTRVQRARARNAAFRQTFNELTALSNRDLDDLGITRADIGAVARQASQNI